MLRPATALGAFVECEHLAWLERQVVLQRLERPGGVDAGSQLLFDKGHAHERSHLETLRARGAEVVEIAGAGTAAVGATLEAMRRGAPFIYQGVFTADGWIGIPDFLQRVERPSPNLGAWSYEVVETKLARRTKPTFLLQLCLYGDLLARAQGSSPELMHVVLGTGEIDPYVVNDFAAYFRRLRGRFLAATADDGPAGQPLPVPFCGMCAWAERCEDDWEKADHLCRVADIRRTQMTRLSAAGIGTMRALAEAPEDQRIRRMVPATFTALRRQARLQRSQAAGEAPRFECLPLAAGRGFALLPPASTGDVFFDMEGDPYFEEGLEYLFGATTVDEGTPLYRSWWAHHREGERQAFEGFMGFVIERRREFPDLHVYHYAAYEPTALKRLAGKFGSREQELDDCLRGGVFVDLFRVVKQGLCISQPGYSIKKVESFYREGKRSGGVVDGSQSIVAYEGWIDTQEDSLLSDIERYNEDDCLSTLQLRDWLAERKQEIPAEEFERIQSEADARILEEKAAEAAAHTPEKEEERLSREALQHDLQAAATGDTAEGRALHLLSHLIEYHQRELRPAYWEFFARMEMDDDELLEDGDSIAGLTVRSDIVPFAEKQSLVHTLAFPADQEFKPPRERVLDPATGKSPGTLHSIDGRKGLLELKRGRTFKDVPFPTALVPGRPIACDSQIASIRRVAEDVRERGIDAEGPYRALRDILLKRPPRLIGVAPGDGLVPADRDVEPAAAADVASRLDDGHLFVQGPPGSGKTWTGARMIVRLLRDRRRVGVMSTSHRAVHNLLDEIERVAAAENVRFRGFKKSSGEDKDFHSAVRPQQIESGSSPRGGASLADFQLLAGTAWFMSEAQLDQSLDHLFIDEAGQVSLADAIAVGAAARNIVLLGDPLQLAQVSKGTHPEGAARSVLEHLLGNRRTIPVSEGLFLGRTWRMHPEVCAFVSDVIYDGRLTSAEGCEHQSIAAPGLLSGTGLRFHPIPHSGNSQRSDDEAAWIAERITDLLKGSFVDTEGTMRPLAPEDILIIAPYNAQVRCLVEHVPQGVAVGTVDKFQGQEAPVVFYSMATSSGEEVPRGVDFLFSRNRLNVAISRARALSVLVASPRLLDVAGGSAGEMRMVNALCRFVEMATEV